MTNQHTPGPWQYLGVGVTDGPVITTTVSGVIDDDEVLGTSEWCRLEDADGRLMAKSPQMLSVLIKLCSLAEDGDVACWVPEWDEAKKIIREATGEDND